MRVVMNLRQTLGVLRLILMLQLCVFFALFLHGYLLKYLALSGRGGDVLHCPVVLALDLERIGLSNLRFGCRECSNRLLAHATTSGRFNLCMDNIEGVCHIYSWWIFFL